MSLLGKWFGFAREEVYERAVRAYDMGDYEGAVEAFEACLEAGVDPSLTRLARFQLCDSYAKLGAERSRAGDYEAAVLHYQRSLSISPNYPDFHLQLAKVYRELGWSDLERRSLEMALSLNPRYVDAIVHQGVLLYESGRHEEGLARIEQAVRIDPALDTERYRYALGAHARGDAARAIANFSAMSTVGLDDANLHTRVADSFARQGMYEEAAQEYSRALKLAPHYADVRCRYGQTLMALGQPREAAEQFREALRVNERYADAHAQLGLALRRMNLQADAQAEFRRALELNPDNPVAKKELELLAG
jgi:tetratricopeptide (TPR) repeat protein